MKNQNKDDLEPIKTVGLFTDIMNALHEADIEDDGTIAEAMLEFMNARPNTNMQKVHSDDVGDVEALKTYVDLHEGDEPFACDVKIVATGEVILNEANSQSNTYSNGWNEALDRVARGPVNAGWVEIADIPEEWKDGRTLDVIHNRYGEYRRQTASYEPTDLEFNSVDGKPWIGACSITSKCITHAKLQAPFPTPPTQAPKERDLYT